MTSLTIISVIEPPNSTPQAGIGVPGRPRSIVNLTTSSSQREKTVFSGGAVYATVLPVTGSVKAGVASPPAAVSELSSGITSPSSVLADAPWQLAQLWPSDSRRSSSLNCSADASSSSSGGMAKISEPLRSDSSSNRSTNASLRSASGNQ
jgi:hypothetical protein